jgi:glutathione synthase/RimK-type ligase-like ATP-grasp enzyme
MILFWGLHDDSPLEAVSKAVHRKGLPMVFLDQRDVGSMEIELSIGARVRGIVRLKNQIVDLETVTAFYLRPHDSRRLPDVLQAGEGSASWRHAIRFEDSMLSWSEVTRCLVINRPSAMASNSSKPYQSLRISAHGFKTPETLVTTSPEAARDFWKMHEKVIYKSVSGIRSIVSRLSNDHLGRFQDIANCPTQFQQYISGVDHRVHVIGSEVVASKVVSDADDYRYASREGRKIKIEATQVPDEIEQRCRNLASDLDLTVAGVDLRKTPTGDWYCFEVNPSPGFTFYEGSTGQPLAEKIASLLANTL